MDIGVVSVDWPENFCEVDHNHLCLSKKLCDSMPGMTWMLSTSQPPIVVQKFPNDYPPTNGERLTISGNSKVLKFLVLRVMVLNCRGFPAVVK